MPTAQKDLTPHAKKSQHARRNDGAISLILTEVRRNLEEASRLDEFHGRLQIEIDIVGCELTMCDVGLHRKLKLK